MTAVDLGPLAFCLITALGLLSGGASMWLFRRFTDPVALRVAINHLVAHLLEFQLFSDEPALILRAQRSLLVANARFLRLAAIPSLLLLIGFAVSITVADGFFSRSSLPTGSAAVVTLRQDDTSDTLPTATLDLPTGMQVETPPVRIAIPQRREWQISWRIRPDLPASGQLRILYNGRVFTQRVYATPGLHWLRQSAPIHIGYPPAIILNVNWLLWFCIFSAVGSGLFLWIVPRASRVR